VGSVLWCLGGLAPPGRGWHIPCQPPGKCVAVSLRSCSSGVVKFTSPVYSAASGSIAGVTYSRNKGGNYTRARAIPSNPNSADQVSVRSKLTTSSQAWSTLTQTQRDAWNALAPTVSWTNALGQSIQLSGINLFNQVNSLRLLAGIALLEDAPADATRQDAPLFNELTTDGTAVNVDTTNTYATTTAKSLVFISRPTNPGRSPTSQPMRFVGIGTGAAAAVRAMSAPDPFASIAIGQIRAIRMVVVDVTLLPSPSVTQVLTAAST